MIEKSCSNKHGAARKHHGITKLLKETVKVTLALVLLFAVLHRLPHSVDSRFGLYHVAVVLSFLRSPISLAEI